MRIVSNGINITACNDVPSVWASTRSKFDNVICTSNQLFIMFNNHDGIAVVDQSIDAPNQSIDIAKMQSRGWLVHDDEVPLGSAFSYPPERLRVLVASILRRKAS